MQINQRLVRLPSIIEEINKKVLGTLSVCKLLFSEHWPLFSERKPIINQVKITLEVMEE